VNHADISHDAAKARACPNWGQLTLTRVLEKWDVSRPDTVFLQAAGRPVMTFAEVNAEVVRLAAVLREQGLRPGDSLLLRAGRRPEGLLMLLAAIHSGLQVCLAPEGMSARQVTEGAVSYAPKIAVDAGMLPKNKPESLRVLEMAANLFTIRLVCCFGAAPDGLLDLAAIEPHAVDDREIPPVDPTRDAFLHILRHGADGKLQRLSRSQSHLLSQALACAMVSELTPSSVVGTAYDPIGAHGLLAAALPALLVGCRLQLFDAVDPSLDARLQLWQEESDHHHLVLPAAFAQSLGLKSGGHTSKRVWVANGPASQGLTKGDHLLVDCDGTALLPAQIDDGGHTIMRPGAITISAKNSGPMAFGTLRLEGGPQENSTAGSLMSGEICLDSPLAAARNGKTLAPQPTGQMARLAEGEERRPTYVLSDKDAMAVQVGSHRVMLPAVNRALGLTGRWQDAAVFAVPDRMLRNRIEVAVEPRAGDDDAQKLPTLAMVRNLLSESGIGDAGLPVKMHLVTRVPRRGRGVVDVDALADHAWDAQEVSSGKDGASFEAVA
jgi:non-ribosomal peptide synthetase component E (peptide arylation enzyme)